MQIYKRFDPVMRWLMILSLLGGPASARADSAPDAQRGVRMPGAVFIDMSNCIFRILYYFNCQN